MLTKPNLESIRMTKSPDRLNKMSASPGTLMRGDETIVTKDNDYDQRKLSLSR